MVAASPTTTTPPTMLLPRQGERAGIQPPTPLLSAIRSLHCLLPVILAPFSGMTPEREPIERGEGA